MSNDPVSTVAIYQNHHDAEQAIQELQKSGFDMKKLSVIGKDYQTEENVIGFYNIGDRMAIWGKLGLFWGAVWGLLFGSAFLIIPNIGPVVIAGPLVARIIGALETALITGGISALVGGLTSIGIPENSALRYEVALKSNKFLLIVHGTEDEASYARSLLAKNKAEETAVHLGRRHAPLAM
jgi:uncharacterized membrane protein